MRNKVLVASIIGALILLFFGTRHVIKEVNGLTLSRSMAIEEEIIIDKPYEKIDVSTKNAKVKFVSSQAEETKVSYGGKKKSKVKFAAKVKGDTLFIQLKEKRFKLFSFSMKGVELTVQLPESVYKEIKAKTDNGIITASNLKADVIHFESDNGLVKLENSEGDTVNLSTNNGQLTFNHVKAHVIGRTDNGRIIYQADKLKNDVDLTTSNGAIHVKLAEKPVNARIHAQTGNGVATIFGAKENAITFGDGKYLLDLRTDNGRIIVEE